MNETKAVHFLRLSGSKNEIAVVAVVVMCNCPTSRHIRRVLINEEWIEG